MKSKLIVFVVSVLIAVSLPGFRVVQCKAPSVAEILPPDSLGYVELPDMGVFYYLISEVGQAALESLEEEADVPGDIKVKARAVLEAFNEVKPLLPKSGSLGIVSIDPQRGQPSLVFVSELSGAIAPLASAAGKLLGAVPEITIKKTEYGAEIVIPHVPVPPIGYAVKDNVLYVAMGEGLLDRTLSMATSNRLSQGARFEEVNAVIGKNAFLSAYLNVDAIREKLMPVLPPQALQIAEMLGVKDIHAAGISLAADEKVVGFNLALQYTEDAPGIPSLLSVPNSSPKGLAYVPEDYSYVGRLSLGPPAQFVRKIQAVLDRAGVQVNMDEIFAQVKQKAGIDVEKVLASLGGEITVGVKLPETIGIPNVVLCVEAKDPEYLLATLKNLLAGESAPASITELELGGRKTMMITPKVPVPVSPALAVDGDMIVIGISSAALQKALAAKASGQNIASKPSFKAAMESFPADKNIALEYIEMQGLGQLMVAGLSMAAAGVPDEAKPLVAKGMVYLNRAVQDLEEGVRVVYRTPNGLAAQDRWGTRSLMQVLKNGAAFAVKAAMPLLIEKIGGSEPEQEVPAAVTQ